MYTELEELEVGWEADSPEVVRAEEKVGAGTVVALAVVDLAVGSAVNNATTLRRVQIRTQCHARTSRRYNRSLSYRHERSMDGEQHRLRSDTFRC